MNRRQFLKRSAGAVTVSVVLPKLWLTEAQGQTPEAASRKIFVVIQLAGGNDGLNTVIPYSDDRYHSLRPRIGFQDSELTNTIINNQLALHPSMT
ncbi:MAG TPA: twin-arginine translocation signal domain-containing protein, partial [Blastocatellia bacterium]|nr:twin-arginine translocation signal domain-containing protein [Blastocatellia bacterium]